MSEEARPLRGNGGISVSAEYDLSGLCEVGTIIIPGWHTRDEAPSNALREALTAAWSDGARLVAICSGSFLLAALGLLDGLRATTHWIYAEKLHRRFPRIEVDADKLFIDAERIYTSAGSAAGIDLCMHILRKDWGSEKANAVARRLLMQPHRDGDQRQFIVAPVASREDDRLHALLERLRSDPQSAWTPISLDDRPNVGGSGDEPSHIHSALP